MLDKKSFFEPTNEYSPVPFWFWNDALEDEELVFQLKEMKDKGINEVIIHARKGLAINYLSEEWFHKVEVSCQAARDLDMKIWIYDENNWPSGYADGKVIEKDPSLAAKCLSVEKIYPVLGEPVIVKEKPDSELVAVSAVYQDKDFVDITDCGRNGKEPWRSKTLSWEVFVFRMEKTTHSPAYSALPYVDLLNINATKAFLDFTHKEYKKRLPSFWGKVIKGFFTDEPGFYQNYLDQAKNLNTIAWTKAFPLRFRERFGYDIRPYLPVLWQDMERSNEVRRDYYQALSALYKESFFDPIKEFLHKDGLLLIGHLHREERLEWLVQTEGDFFSAIDGLDYSGIDCIDKNFPRLSEKLASSAADLLDKPRTLSETFGCFSWALTPSEIKERIDLQYVQGINMMVLHAFFYSIEGIRKTESPPSLFIQNSYWPYFKKISTYVSRLSLALSQGKHDCKVAVYYPSRKASRLFAPLSHYSVKEIDECLDRLVLALLNNGIDFELVNEDFIEKGSISKKSLAIDNNYEALILPCYPDLDIEEKIEQFSTKGNVIILGKKKGKEGKKALFRYYEEDEAVTYLLPKLSLKIRAQGIFVYSRKNKGFQMMFLLNHLDKDNIATIKLAKGELVEQYDLETGEVRILASATKDKEIKLALSSRQSILLSFRKGKGKAIKKGGYSKSIPLVIEKVLFNGENRGTKLNAHANGIHNFDGTVSLSCKVDLPSLPKKAKLSLGRVFDFTSVSCNGLKAGSRLWMPYDFDISPFLKLGENLIEIDIKNVKGNAFGRSDFNCGILDVPILLIGK